MGKELSHCINHPGNKAKRRCYQCLSPICPSCQLRAIGHIFCSKKCQALCWTSETNVKIKRLFLRASLRIRKVEREFERIAGSGMLRIISIVLLLILLNQVLALNRSVRELQMSELKPVPAHGSPTLSIEQADDGITLSGSALGFATVILLVDGAERDVGAVRSGQFQFHLERKDNDRSAQVQVYGNDLPALYSRSVRFPEITRPSSAMKSPSRPEPAAKTAVKPEEQLPKPDKSSLHLVSSDINRGDPYTKRVAITFDGGSQGNAAAQILDLLSARGLSATFFLTGTFMKRFPDLTRRIAKGGHEVGNHTYKHPHLTTWEKKRRHETLPGINSMRIHRELVKNSQLFKKLTGKDMVPMWRAPYGEHNSQIRKWALDAGFRHVSWTYDPDTRMSLDTLDWVADKDSGLYLSSEQIVDKILSFDRKTEQGLKGGIILLHLGSERIEDPFFPNLASLLDELEGRGYSVGSVSSLLSGG
ncbi:MAG: polysaccharide deacetylase family protein [bacterium]